MKFNKNDWLRIGRWVQPALSACFWDNWSRDKYALGMGSFSGRMILLDGYAFLKKSDLNLMEKIIDSNKNERFFKILQKWVKDAHLKAKKDISIRFDNIIKTLANFKTLFNEIIDLWMFFIIANEIITQEIKELSQKHNLDFEKVMEEIKPAGKSFIEQQNQEAKELYQKIKKKGISKLMNEIKKHVRKFESCGVHHFVGEPYSVKTFIKNYKEDLAKPRAVKEIKKPIKLPKELQWYVQLASYATYGRLRMAETSDYAQYQIKPVLLKANNQLNLKKDEYLWLTIDEIINSLKNPEKFKKPDIQKRKQKIAVLNENGKEIILAGKEVDRILDELLEIRKISFPLKGRVACKGKVTGKARIVVKPEDIYKVKKGDILVAPETTPDFVPAMKKASAVITELGGITSHAAIVSRELKIPCIIGVQDATQIIKNNDQLEVDAEKGIIKKIRR